VSEPSSSERLRAAVDNLRASNDRLARKLHLDPVEQRVADAEREALRLCRMVPRAPESLIVASLVEACHKLLDADVALAKSKHAKGA